MNKKVTARLVRGWLCGVVLWLLMVLPALMRVAAAVPAPDSTPPTVAITSVSGPPAQAFFTFRDTGSGLASIVVTNSDNADTVTPPFVPGTTDPVIVTSTKINQSQPFFIRIEARDIAGNLLVASTPGLVVTTTADVEDDTDGQTSLREAIKFANTDGVDSAITFDPTVFAAKQTIKLGGTQLGLANNGKLTITGPEAGVVIDANQQSRVFSVASGADVTLDGLTISNGKISGSSSGSSSSNEGGGIFNDGTLNVTNSTLSGNSVSSSAFADFNQGGGIYNNGTLNITGSTLSDNSAGGGSGIGNANRGGGIYNNGGTLNITGSTLSGNSATSSDGSGNSGGGIYNPSGTLNITGSTLSNNSATGSDGSGNSGGGITNGGTLNITNSTLSGNSASGDVDSDNRAGGIYNNGTLNITGSTLSGNSASGTIKSNQNQGGGIYNLSGTLNITNSTLSGNSVSGSGNSTNGPGSQGGGIFHWSGTLTLTNSTLSGNSVSGGSVNQGGGIYNQAPGTFNTGGTVNSSNSIIAANTAATGPDVFGAFSSQGYNLIGNSGGATITGDTTGNILNTNAKLGILKDNGGPTFTRLPASDSPAVNKGDTDLDKDQRGISRPQPAGGADDIGAVEVDNSAPTISDIAKTASEDTALAFAAADFDAGFADADNDTLTKIKITALPTHGTLKIDGVAAQVGDEIERDDIDTLTYKPSLNYHATDSFGWNGSDGIVYATTPAKVNITVDEVNDDPVFDPTSLEISGNEGQLITFFAPGSDVDTGTVLEYSLVGAPTGATINAATGEFKWTPSEAQGPGDYTFQIKVIDGEGGEAFLGVTLHIAEANIPPVLPAISAKSVNEGSKLAFTLSPASDSDIPANTLTYSASGLPTGATFNVNTRAFSWTPTELQGPDAYNIAFKVSDGKGGEASRIVTITVNEVNQPPVVSLGANRSVVGGVPFSFGFSASDPDRPSTGLAFNLANSPSWLGLTNAPAFYGTAPVSLSTYTANVTVVANDTSGAKAQSSMTLTVTPPPVAWFVTPTWSSTEGTLTYTLKNNKTQAISGIWVTGKLPVAVKSVTKSVGTVSTQAQAGGKTDVTWNGFNLAAGQQATLTLKVARPARGVQVAYGLYCSFAPTPPATLTTADVFAP
jgi:CSLREA domain-containing protein